jgi:hypothetical protein
MTDLVLPSLKVPSPFGAISLFLDEKGYLAAGTLCYLAFVVLVAAVKGRKRWR